MTPPPSLPPTGEGLPEEIASYSDKIQITFERRPDGGLRVYSDELPGLVLSHAEHAAVLADLRPAIEGLLSAAPSGMAVAASLGRQLSAARARAERAEKALRQAAEDLANIANSADPSDDAVGTEDHKTLIMVESMAREACDAAFAALSPVAEEA